MDNNVLVHQYIDTGLNADSVEFCPYVNQQNILLCGTYKLQEESSQQSVNDEPDQKCSAATSQTRLGGVTVLKLSSHDGSPKLSNVSQIDMCGILDIKWPGVQLNGKSIFGLVDAEGFFQIFHLEDKENTPILVGKEHLSESSLGLSLGWDGGKDRDPSKAVCSDSTGSLTVFSVDNDKPSILSRWHAHDYEAWIAAFHDFDSNIVYSGGDDCTLKGWDVRDTTKPTFVSRRHTMGVCSIQSHPFDESIYATGSYDEELLIWDRRQQKRPLTNANLGGGVWRIKWDPFSGHYILTATMYNGTHIVKADDLGVDSLPIVVEHNDHNLAYGADWCRLDKDLTSTTESFLEKHPMSFLISTCSFYDHSLHLWEWMPSIK